MFISHDPSPLSHLTGSLPSLFFASSFSFSCPLYLPRPGCRKFSSSPPYSSSSLSVASPPSPPPRSHMFFIPFYTLFFFIFLLAPLPLHFLPPPAVSPPTALAPALPPPTLTVTVLPPPPHRSLHPPFRIFSQLSSIVNNAFSSSSCSSATHQGHTFTIALTHKTRASPPTASRSRTVLTSNPTQRLTIGFSAWGTGSGRREREYHRTSKV